LAKMLFDRCSTSLRDMDKNEEMRIVYDGHWLIPGAHSIGTKAYRRRWSRHGGGVECHPSNTSFR
jgi:hypothetical protein